MACSLLESKRFFCREWAFLKINHSLEQRSVSKTCGTMIVGGPGTGKTALCCEIVWPCSGSSSRQQRSLHRRLLAYHFCQAHDASTLSVAEFVRGLVTQILATSCATDDNASSSHMPKTFTAADSYAEKVRTDPEILAALRPDALERDPDEAFKRAVLFPLLEIESPKQCLFLLVDSIDEAQCLGVTSSSLSSSSRHSSLGPSRTIAELLANHHHLFPHWLLLVCTARRQSKAVSRMFTGFRKISLDDLRKCQVVRDVQQYILSRLDQEENLRQHISRDTAEMLNQLHIKSNGCFLYLEKVLDGVAENFIVLREVREIPGTLNGLYLWLCQRLFNRKQFSKVLPLLNAILAARRPLTQEQLYHVVWTSNTTMSREEYQKRLHLLRRVISVCKDGTLLLFHHSFAEWLLDVKHCTQKYLCSAAEGHAMLAMNSTLQAKQLNAEEVQGFAYHLVKIPVPSPAILSEINSTCGFEYMQLLVLWLVDSGAHVEDSLIELYEGVTSAGQLSSTLPTPKDPRILKLLVDAGAELKNESITDGTGPKQSDISLISQVPEDCSSIPETIRDSLVALLGEDGDVNKVDHSGSTLLHILATEGNAHALELAIMCRNANLEATDRHGQAPLNLAARHGYEDVVSVLLAAGAQADHADCDGWTALRAAAWGGHTQVVEALLEHGAAVDCADSDQRTALRAAAWGGHEEIVLALLQHGADVNRTDDEGRTALIAAAYMGHSEIVEHLLDFGAEINHADADGRTALSVAALCVPSSEGYAKVVNILLERGAAVDHQDKDGMTPLLVAAFEGHRDVCELLLEYEADVDHADRSGRTPLWAASSMGHPAVVELLLFWGCYIDSIDPEGRTVLSVAAAQGGTDVVKQLLDRGLDEQHRDNSGWTPLHYAAFEGHIEVCEALLEAGARVDEADNDGKGPLMLAAQEGHVRLIETLLTFHSAPPDQRGHDGKTAFRLAVMEGHMEVMRVLLNHGADVNTKDADGRSTLYVLALENRLPMARFLLDEGNADIETKDLEGRTPLHVSAWQGHVEMVALLLSFDADVNATDNENRTALHSASWQGHAAIVQLLLERGATPDHTCNQGATALGIAAQEGHEECVKALLSHGADPNHSDRCGRNALRVAAKSGHDAVVRMLEEHSVNHKPIASRPVPNGGGGSSSATSVTSGSTAETKPSSAILYPPGPNMCPVYSPVDSPNSTKRRSFVSLGNNSSNSKSSSNFTCSTKSSQQSQDHGGPDGGIAVTISPLTYDTYQGAATSASGPILSFTQQLQQCTRGTKNRPLSRLLSPLHSVPQSPIYASPPHSPFSDIAAPSSPLSANPLLFHGSIPSSDVHANTNAVADPHFARDTHMRIILGNRSLSQTTDYTNAFFGSRGVGSGGAGAVATPCMKSCRNGIVTNPALRIVAGVKNGLDAAAGKKHAGASRLYQNPGQFNKANDVQWRKETPL
ncbi:ankyrin repeat domain-containing protein 50 [Bacillus rossius redtenbacheri]|uniref:ankyrin repeat domain-containing protein 50 n=1 Tax=Bacillus rossius redtenbacheri TaxID=93214 RepID=UPI002FDEEC83